MALEVGAVGDEALREPVVEVVEIDHVRATDQTAEDRVRADAAEPHDVPRFVTEALGQRRPQVRLAPVGHLCQGGGGQQQLAPSGRVLGADRRGLVAGVHGQRRTAGAAVDEADVQVAGLHQPDDDVVDPHAIPGVAAGRPIRDEEYPRATGDRRCATRAARCNHRRPASVAGRAVDVPLVGELLLHSSFSSLPIAGHRLVRGE